MSLFQNGVPTEPDVASLIERFGIPDEERVISYGEISECIHVPHGESRFRTVVDAWRKRLRRQYNVEARAISGVGIKVLNPSNRVRASTADYRSGFRKIVRAADLASTTDENRLSEADKKTRETLIMVQAKIQVAAATAAKELRYPKPGVLNQPARTRGA